MNGLLTWVAVAVGFLLAATQWLLGPWGGREASVIPLLALLFMNEFGFVLAAIGALLGVKALKNREADRRLVVGVALCCLFALGFLLTGVSLWPRSTGA